MPVGAGHITNDIAIGLRTSVEIAEKVKSEHGTALPEEVSKRDNIDLAQFGEDGLISKLEVAEIIEARLEEIFSIVNKELKNIGRAGMLPAGIVLTGGGARLKGMVEVAKKSFNLPASIGEPKDFKTAIYRIHDPVFATAVGLVIWGANIEKTNSRGFIIPKFSSVVDVTGKMKKWFKSLLP